MFIGGSPMKLATNRLLGLCLDLGRGAELLQLALLHHSDAVGQRDRLGLVVGHEHRRHLVLDQIVLEPRAQDGAQLRLELRHRLVQQRDRCAADQRAGQRGALLLAGGDHGRVAVEDVGDLQQLGDVPDALLDVGAGAALAQQAKPIFSRTFSGG
jgi:hypothetical protein